MLRETIVLLLALLPLMGATAALAETSTNTTAPACAPGSYAYNLSGQFICIPEVNEVNTPLAGIRAMYVSDNTVNITLTCMGETGCNFYLVVVDADTGQKLLNGPASVQPGEEKTIQLQVQGNDPLLVNATVNGFQYPLFLVQPKFKELRPGLYESLKSNYVLYTMYSLLFVAIPIGLLLRGNGREAGIAIMASSVLLPRLVIELGAPPPLAYTVTGLSFLVGVLVAALYT